MPKFQDLNVNRDSSLEWARANHEEFMGKARAAVNSRIERHIAEKGVPAFSEAAAQ
jgi:limonene 1,2-monooxygenase